MACNDTKTGYQDLASLADITISCDSADTAPCSVAGTIDLAANNDLTECTACEETPVYKVAYFDLEGFSDVSITDTTLTYTTSDDAVGGKLYNIEYIAVCGAYKGVASIKVCLTDLCDGVSCPAGQKCDPCDGTCVDKDINLNITISKT